MALHEPDHVLSDTEVLRYYAGQLNQIGEDLTPVRDTFRADGPARLPVEVFESRTGWLHVLSGELMSFKHAYDGAVDGTWNRLHHIRSAVVEAARLLGEAADGYDATDRHNAKEILRSHR